jgi:hypothetical protein
VQLTLPLLPTVKVQFAPPVQLKLALGPPVSEQVEPLQPALQELAQEPLQVAPPPQANEQLLFEESQPVEINVLFGPPQAANIRAAPIMN